MPVQGLVLDVDGFSTHDGPGIRTAVFFKGCPLSCRWCHSPESQRNKTELLYRSTRCSGCLRCVEACPFGAVAHNPAVSSGTNIIINREKCRSCFTCVEACNYKALQAAGTFMDAEELAEKISADLPFFKNSGGGVTVSGGEPLMQPGFTAALMKACKIRGIQTLLETCGYGSGDSLMEIAAFCDIVYFDIKILENEKHKEWTGVSNKLILNNLARLCAEGMAGKITVRVPCIPGVNDAPEDVAAVAEYITRLGINSIQLLPYNPMAGEKYAWISGEYSLEDCKPRTQEYYDELNNVVKERFVKEKGNK